jgi:ribosomal protein S18 acetylase RimI-like enzyme
MSSADEIKIRPAQRQDVPAIIGLLADDALGQEREQLANPLPSSYLEAFDVIARDERNLMFVAEGSDGAIRGYLQMTFIPGLSYRGAERALIEDVRVDSRHRGRGIGRQLLDRVVDEAGKRGCRLAQLFVHQTRSEARRFYAGLGFQESHVGMRLALP